MENENGHVILQRSKILINLESYFLFFPVSALESNPSASIDSISGHATARQGNTNNRYSVTKTTKCWEEGDQEVFPRHLLVILESGVV